MGRAFFVGPHGDPTNGDGAPEPHVDPANGDEAREPPDPGEPTTVFCDVDYQSHFSAACRRAQMNATS